MFCRVGADADSMLTIWNLWSRRWSFSYLFKSLNGRQYSWAHQRLFLLFSANSSFANQWPRQRPLFPGFSSYPESTNPSSVVCYLSALPMVVVELGYLALAKDDLYRSSGALSLGTVNSLEYTMSHICPTVSPTDLLSSPPAKDQPWAWPFLIWKAHRMLLPPRIRW